MIPCTNKIKYPKIMAKMSFILLAIAFWSFLFMGEAYAQVGGAAVKANFGIDADVYADTTQFGPLVGDNTTDDWFDRKTGLSGVGVIDTAGGGAFRAMILSGGADANRTFVRRQAFPKSTVINGKLFFDAIYARDNHSVGGSRDSSVFTATADKNIDNPKSWNLGTAGTPRKDDIVDAYAHLRRDGPSVSDSLWLMVGVSTMDADGNKHTDYGFFRNNVGFEGGVLTNLGPDSGHTAWKVVSGSLQPGDFVLSVDFEGGGEIPTVAMFLWITIGDQTAISAANPLIVFTGEYYDGGTNAGPFGYARIIVPTGAAFAKVNTTDNTLAAPWGSLEGPSASFENDILTLQLAEAGVNLTAMGLDPGAGADPCVDLFGSVMFKSRSSASFVSEMKDFVGPYEFGRVIKVVLSLAKTDLTCYGSNDGTITATWTGGIPPHSIKLDGGSYVPAVSPHVFTNVTAGTHWVYVQDQLGCSDTMQITLTQPTEVTLSLTKVDLTCNGSSDGKITATFGGGTPPYQIQIDGGALAAATSPHVFTGLAAGLHTVRVVDSRDVYGGCEKTETITLTEPPLVTLSLTKVDLTCNGSNDGQITATFGGGTPPYQIQIDGGALAAATSPHVFSGLAAGLHTVRVVDSRDVYSGCEKTETITLTEPPLVTLSLTKVDLSCNGSNDGQITATFGGGTPPYQIQIDGGALAAATSPHVFTGLAAGSYTVRVVDSRDVFSGCEKTESVTLTEPPLVTLSLTKVDLTCNGSNDGKITATFGGGTPPYQIQIDGGALAAATSPHVFTGLAAGLHTVRVVDSRDVFSGCEKTETITLTQPPLVTLSLTKVDLTCNGSSDGQITATFGGGTPPYQIQIDGGALAAATSPHVFTGLAAGLHTVRVVDSRDVYGGCEKTETITLTEPALVTLVLTKIDLTCNGSSDGKITATFGGGTPPYQIQIDGGTLAAATSPHVFTGLAAGTYTVRVVDSRNVYGGCEKTQTITLTEPALVTLSLTKVDLTCNGSNDGKITATFGGGTPPYQIQIDGGALAAATSPHVFSGLAAGLHTVRVVDSRNVYGGCEKTETITLTEPALVTLSLTKVDLTCYGSNDGKITATFGGGTPPYQIQIDGGALAAATSPHVFTGLAAGLHTVRVVDSRDVFTGCEKIEETTLEEPPDITCTLSRPETLPDCNSTGNTLCVTASGGTGTLLYTWSVLSYGSVPWVITAGLGTNCITYSAGNDSAMFKVIITDANGCEDSCEVEFPCIPQTEGCTPGFWQGGSGKKYWNVYPNDPQWIAAGGIGSNPYKWDTKFSSFFTASNTGVDDLTMFQLVSTGGGPTPVRKAARSLVAAYLNSSFGMAYPWSTSQLHSMWTAAVSGGNAALLALHIQLDDANKLNCPIGGSLAKGGLNEDIPEEYGLSANYPNPFNPATVIEYNLPEPSNVRLAVYNILGQEISVLINSVMEKGYHYVEWNAVNNQSATLPSGIYIYRIDANSTISSKQFTSIKKMILMR